MEISPIILIFFSTTVVITAATVSAQPTDMEDMATAGMDTVDTVDILIMEDTATMERDPPVLSRRTKEAVLLLFKYFPPIHNDPKSAFPVT